MLHSTKVEEENTMPGGPFGQDHIVTSPENANKDPSPKPAKTNLALGIIALLLVLTIAGVWAGYRYIFLNPKRILAKSIQNFSEVQTFDYEGQFTYSYKENDSKDIVSFFVPKTYTIDISGTSDVTNLENPKSKAKIRLNENRTNLLTLDLVTSEKKLYFKIDKLPIFLADFISSDEILNQLDQWVEVNFEELQQEYPLFFPEDYEFGLTENNLNDIQNALIQYPPFEVSTDYPSTKINDEPAYHYGLTLNKDNLIEYITTIDKSYSGRKYSELEKQSLRESLDEVDIESFEIWIRKSDLMPVKFLITITTTEEFSNSALSLESYLSNFDEPKDIEPPQSTISAVEFINLFLGTNDDSLQI